MPTFPFSDQIHTFIAMIGGMLLAFHPLTNGTAILNEVQTIAGAVIVVITAVTHILALAHVRVNAPTPVATPIAPTAPLAAPQIPTV